MIVVDNEQEDMKNILAWARPTLETTQIKGRLRFIAKDKKSITLDVGRGDLTFFTLPRAEPELKKLKEGTAVVVSFYKIDGKYYATKIRAGHEIQPFTDDITVRV